MAEGAGALLREPGHIDMAIKECNAARSRASLKLHDLMRVPPEETGRTTSMTGQGAGDRWVISPRIPHSVSTHFGEYTAHRLLQALTRVNTRGEAAGFPGTRVVGIRLRYPRPDRS